MGACVWRTKHIFSAQYEKKHNFAHPFKHFRIRDLNRPALQTTDAFLSACKKTTTLCNFFYSTVRRQQFR